VSGLAEVSCWAELPEGDYVARVGGALDGSVTRQWKFCGGIHYQAKQTELYFSVEFGVCIASLARSHSNVCNNVLKVTTLYVEIHLSGDFSLSQSLASGSSQVIKSFIDTFLYKKIGQFSVSADISSTSFEDSSVTVGVLVGVNSLNDAEVSSLVSVLKESAENGLATSSLDLHGEYGIETMSFRSIKYWDEVEDMHAIDESSFHLITNFVTTDLVLEDRQEHSSTSTMNMKYYFKELEHDWYAYASAAVTLAILVVVVFSFNSNSNNDRDENNPRLLKETSSTQLCVDDDALVTAAKLKGCGARATATAATAAATATATATGKVPIGDKKRNKMDTKKKLKMSF
jgi:hypothetical protein